MEYTLMIPRIGHGVVEVIHQRVESPEIISKPGSDLIAIELGISIIAGKNILFVFDLLHVFKVRGESGWSFF